MSRPLVWLKTKSQMLELGASLCRLSSDGCLYCETANDLHEHCRLRSPDLVILDLDLDPMKSWLLIFEILQIQHCCRPYIVVLADIPMAEEQLVRFNRRKALCYEFGADLVTLKPVVESTLKGWVTLGNICQDRWTNRKG